MAVERTTSLFGKEILSRTAKPGRYTIEQNIPYLGPQKEIIVRDHEVELIVFDPMISNVPTVKIYLRDAINAAKIITSGGILGKALKTSFRWSSNR